VRQLTSLDAQFLSVETSRTYGHVGGLAVYDASTAPGGRLETEDICRLVAERLHLLPVFRWRLAPVPFNLDLPYWIEDPDFDLDFHVRESAVPPPGDDRKLAETVARIFARPLDRARPLWEVYLIQGLEGDRAALLTKIHHSVVDGVSGNEILSVLLDPSPEGREPPPPPPESADRERPPGELEMLARGLMGLPRQPLRALRALPTTAPNVTELPGANAIPGMPTLTRVLSRARRLLGAEEDPAVLEVTTARPPRTTFNGPISAHRRFALGSLSLDTVRAIKRELKISVNDVVVALCASALREWLLERDELPEDPLVAMVPVSVRTTEERGTFGNRISMMVVPIPTNEPDLGRRVARTHELLRRAKERHRALPASLLTDATQFIPPAVMARAARTTVDVLGRTRPPLNLVISNVPGPRRPLYFAGALLQAHYPVSAIVDGVGLNITVMSYRDHLDFGIVADREQVDDVWSLIDGARRALDELAALVGVGTERPAAGEPAAAAEPPVSRPASQPVSGAG
jgi:diacylglycerol O-acyltransferase / wax synthase